MTRAVLLRPRLRIGHDEETTRTRVESRGTAGPEITMEELRATREREQQAASDP